MGSANGFTDEERLLSSNLSPGVYTVEVKMYTGDGPSEYSIGYTVQENQMNCEDDALEGAGNNSINTATPIGIGQDYALSLCANDLDYFSFSVQRADRIEINSMFSHSVSDIDLRLIAPADTTGTPHQLWYANTSTDDEQIIIPSAPVAGTYILEVKQISSNREPDYDLRIDITPAAACDPDRFESNNTPQMNYPLSPELYQELRACADEDWYETNIAPGRNLILYLTYDSSSPIVTAQGPSGALTPVGQTFFEPVDGCLTERANCKRYLIDPGLNGGLIRYGISFLSVGVEYDIRVRIGDEVGASCFDEFDCNSGFECIYSFDVYSFDYGLCSKSCSNDSDCGRGRVCAIDAFGTQSCLQRCDRGLSCRYEFTCQSNVISTAGESVQACLSDTFVND